MDGKVCDVMVPMTTRCKVISIAEWWASNHTEFSKAIEFATQI
jgi:hypothetical protein